jgi:flagellar protein FliJ
MAKISNSVLNTLLEQASGVFDMAMRKAVIASKEHEEEHSKLEMLQGYRQDYIVNLNKLMSRGVTKEMHLNYHNFLNKLDQAIVGQEEMVVMTQYRLETQRGILQEAQRKKKSFEMLLARQQKEQHKQMSKREQKMMDEFAARKRHASPI